MTLADADLPVSVTAFAGELAARLTLDSGGRLTAAVVHGSAALGGWQPGRSDVDLLFLVADSITEMDLRRMTLSILTMSGGCPGSCAETSIVAAAAALAPAPPWPYLRHVVAGPAADSRVAPRPGDQAHDPDLLMHYVVSRAAGVSVCGPPAAGLFGEVPRPAVLAYLADDLDWGLAQAPEAYCVLNACRAQMYLTDGAIISKIAGARAVLARGAGPAAVISRALDQQTGRLAARTAGPDAAEFIQAMAARLRAAGAGGAVVQTGHDLR
jgi:hypothetical protein